MDSSIFVENVKFYCMRKGVKPTNACKEAGVGGSFLSDINRGQTPSVAKVQQLARYLGATTSELLGEAAPTSGGIDLTAEEIALIQTFRAADDATRLAVTRVLALPPSKATRGGVSA